MQVNEVNIRKVRRSIVKQEDTKDCGPACLLSTVRYYGGDTSLEKIRELSGCTADGTSFLGLQEAAHDLNLSAEGYKTTTSHLKQVKQLSILLFEVDQIDHFVLFFGFSRGVFHIGDPMDGYYPLSESELKEKWPSGKLLLLEPEPQFSKANSINNERKQWFFSLLREHRAFLLVVFLLGVAVTILGLFTAIFTQKLIDVLIPNANLEKLLIGLISWGVLFLITIFLNYLRNVFLATNSLRINLSITSGFIELLFKKPRSFYFSKRVGDLMVRLNDTDHIENAIQEIVSATIIKGLMALSALGVLFWYQQEVGMVITALLPTYFTVAYLYHKPLIYYQRIVMQNEAFHEANYIETIDFIDEIKSYTLENQFVNKQTSIYENFQNSKLRMAKYLYRFSFLINLLGAFIVFVVVAYCTFSVLIEEMKVGELIACMSISTLFVQAISELAMTNIKFQGARLAFDRVFEFAGEENESLNSDSISPFQKLDLQKCSFRFRGQPLLFENVNMTINKGEIVVLFGESGSGKSTLIHLIQGFHQLDSGTILLNEKTPLPKLPKVSWRNKLGVVGQDVNLITGDLFTNICLKHSSESVESDVKNFCVNLGFDTYFNRFPQGYYTRLGNDGTRISGGQKQLIGLARALYHQPELILLDEPTTGMDGMTKHFVYKLLDRLKSEMGILIVTHSIIESLHANQIYVLEGKSISTFGSPADLLNKHNYFSESYKSLQL